MTALTSEPRRSPAGGAARARAGGLDGLGRLAAASHGPDLARGSGCSRPARRCSSPGIQLHRLYAAEIRHGCLGPSAWSAACRPLQDTFGFGWPHGYINQVILAMQAVPVIIGVFAGAPLLAREYTAGTVRFAWTQGIGRTRWAVATLGLLGAAVAAVACLLGLLAQWSVQPVAAQTTRFADRWEPGVFDSTALTAATAALLAFAIGVLAGALIRRAVAAMAVTAVGAITVANLTYNRLHYWLVGQGLRLTRDLAFGANPNVGILSGGPIDIHETVGPPCPAPPAPGWTRAGTPAQRAPARQRRREPTSSNKHTGTGPAWLTRLHDTFWVTYQPAVAVLGLPVHPGRRHPAGRPAARRGHHRADPPPPGLTQAAPAGPGSATRQHPGPSAAARRR